MSLTATLANALSGPDRRAARAQRDRQQRGNANTEGYVRKVLTQEAVFIGSRGAGVQASEISRITDQFLTAEVRRQASVVGRKARSSDAIRSCCRTRSAPGRRARSAGGSASSAPPSKRSPTSLRAHARAPGDPDS